MTLPKHHTSGCTPDHAVAPPTSTRKPVMTSSNSRSAPTRSHSARKPSRKPGSGAINPVFAATGSTATSATSASSVGTTLYGTTTVSATAPGVTPAEPTSPCSARPLPPAASSASEWPW